jgi:hypothetical protein
MNVQRNADIATGRSCEVQVGSLLHSGVISELVLCPRRVKRARPFAGGIPCARPPCYG